MKVLQFLSLCKSIDEGLAFLSSEFGISVKRHEDRIHLNYLQYLSDANGYRMSSIVKECRGLILSYDLKVMARPFDRFFNYFELGDHYQFPTNDITAVRKIDGTFIEVYEDSSQFCCSTRGNAFGDSVCTDAIFDTPKTFRMLFEEALGDSLDNVFKDFKGSGLTIMFELVSPQTRIITPYPELDIYLLGIRENEAGRYKTLDEMDAAISSIYSLKPIKIPEVSKAVSIKQVIEMANALPADQEGFVCWDQETGTRVKVKNLAYLKLHSLKNNGAITARVMCEKIFAGEHQEFLSYFPDYKNLFEPYLLAFENLSEMTLKGLQATQDIVDPKELAQKLRSDYPLVMHLVMSMRKYGHSFHEAFNHNTGPAKLRLMAKVMNQKIEE